MSTLDPPRRRRERVRELQRRHCAGGDGAGRSRERVLAATGGGSRAVRRRTVVQGAGTPPKTFTSGAGSVQRTNWRAAGSSPRVPHYYLTVPHEAEDLTVTPSEGFDIEYLDGDDEPITDTSTPALDVSLPVGKTLIKVRVTNVISSRTGGSRVIIKTYTLHVRRVAGTPSGTCSVIWCANFTFGTSHNSSFKDWTSGYTIHGGGLAPGDGPVFQLGHEVPPRDSDRRFPGAILRGVSVSNAQATEG